METKPKVKLIGEDGNAYAIMGACKKAAMKAGWDNDKILKMLDEMMMADDYDHLLRVAMAHFEVE